MEKNVRKYTVTFLPLETVLADFCNGCIARHESVRLVEQRNILKGD